MKTSYISTGNENHKFSYSKVQNLQMTQKQENHFT